MHDRVSAAQMRIVNPVLIELARLVSVRYRTLMEQGGRLDSALLILPTVRINKVRQRTEKVCDCTHSVAPKPAGTINMNPVAIFGLRMFTGATVRSCA
jgi:hypothetical protein